MKQNSTLDKIKVKKPLADSNPVVWLRDRIYPLLMLLARTKVKYKVNVLNTYSPLPNKPIIFVCNHQAFPDTPLLLRILKRRSYILAGKQNLAFVDMVFFSLIGTIWVDRKSKEDMIVSKDGILAILRDGHSICWFPEGTWNLTPNKLIMPLKWGVIDVAHQADAQIIPVVFDYNHATLVCHAKFGKPIYDSDLEDKAKGIENLRDALATLRLELMYLNPSLKRSEISPQQLKEDVYKSITEYPHLDWEYEQSCIFNPHETVDIMPKDIIPNKNNAFLFNKRLN